MTRLPSFVGFHSPACRPGRRLAVLALVAGLGLAACDGDTIYDGDVTGPGGPVTPPGSGSVRGQYVALPAPGVIADLVVDTTSGNLFLSNRTTHRVEVLDLETLAFGSGVPVGSQPWGLAMNRTGDTLIVANSGGINVSFVPTAALAEDVAKRFEIPRITLYEVNFLVEGGDSVQGSNRVEGGDTIYDDIIFYNYTDRPQYVAQDAEGRLLYSALSTQAAPVGTIRVAELQPGWREWDAQLLFHERALNANESRIAIANADSVFIVGAQAAVIYDHVPGSVPRRHLVSDPLPLQDAAEQLILQGAELTVYPGASWRLPEGAEVADTTFVASSANREWVVFGESPRDRAGRIMMWSAERGELSEVEDISDIVNNTSDQFFGVELNTDGSLGVARGTDATYFFGNDLRLQGLTRTAGMPAGAGLLPNATGSRTLAFVAAPGQMVQIVETTHYTVVGEIRIRSNLVGPLRVAPSRNPATACPANFREGAADCVVATVYGVTDARQVLVLDVLQSDIAEVQ